MSQRLQLALTVAAVALAAAGTVVALTLETRNNPPKLHPQPGRPPVPSVLPGAVGAQVRQAFADWPRGSVATLSRLGQQHPKNAFVQLYLGIGLFWAGYTGEAGQALEQVKKKGIGYDTRWEVAADNILHPQFAPNYPIFQPIRPNALLEQGSRLQQEGRQHSAEAVYQRAAARAPDDDEAQVAVAVGAFDKDNITPAFARLGPLTRRFPRSQIARFYLGELLAWTAQRQEACTQFRKTVALGASTALGRDAKSFLGRVCTSGTGRTNK